MTIEYGNAVVPTLADTTIIRLAPGEWTDFSLPYSFPIYSGDIIVATDLTEKGISDSLELYQWIPSGNSYTTDPIFLPGIESASDPKTVLSGGGAFAAFNTSAKPIPLSIPPVCTLLSYYGNPAHAKKTGSYTKQWYVKMVFFDESGNRMPSIFCASLPSSGNARFFRRPPTFLPVSVAIIDSSKGNRYGHSANGTLDKGGSVFSFIFENNSTDPHSVTGKIETQSGLPHGIIAKLFRKSECLDSRLQDSTVVKLQAKSAITGYLVVGNESFISDFIKKVRQKKLPTAI